MSEPSLSENASKLAEFGRRASETSDALRALSHEHRLMILCLLTGRERSVGELEQILQLPQPAVSQQLARLRLDDLVSSRRDGRTIYYTTETEKLSGIYRSLGILLGHAPESAEAAVRIDAEIAAAHPPVPMGEEAGHQLNA
jgi:DNA-binding transcriptional ArsR family regulator